MKFKIISIISSQGHITMFACLFQMCFLLQKNMLMFLKKKELCVWKKKKWEKKEELLFVYVFLYHGFISMGHGVS
jgi:hypothetical protein